MAESVQSEPTSLQYRLLLKKLAVTNPVTWLRKRRIAALQGLARESEIKTVPRP